MTELRCEECDKLLGKIDKKYEIGYLELKCTRCKRLNKYGKETLEVQDD